jgi:hypothetical protein
MGGENMRISQILSAGLICLLSFHQSPAIGDNKKPELISQDELKRAIEKKYPVKSKAKGSDLHFDPEAKIEAIESPLLREYLPKTRFFLTILNTDYYEYRKVWTVISASRSSDKVSIQECFRLTFTGIPKEFIAQFLGLQAKSTADRKKLALAIGEVLAKATGELRNGRFEKSDYWMEVWTGDSLWRYIVIRFDDMGSVKKVDVIHPADVNKSDQ